MAKEKQRVVEAKITIEIAKQKTIIAKQRIVAWMAKEI